MIVRDLQIINFRNITFAQGRFEPGLNVICGRNGQGKTNLLEAVSMLVTGKSFRSATERELVPWERADYEASIVRARIERGGIEDRFLLTFTQAEKHVSINGTPLRRLGELFGKVNAVLFVPADLLLVQGSPSERRRFLDLAQSQISPQYLESLQRYEQALRQRNSLLKQAARRSIAYAQFAPWDTQLAEHGARLQVLRCNFLRRISGPAADHYKTMSDDAEQLALEYEAHPKESRACLGNQAALAERLLTTLRDGFQDDLRRGHTTAGPHRDDFQFLLTGRDARNCASQGQQRSCVLALKLAEAACMRATTGEAPLLLLDDLMSELDEYRKSALFETLDPASQTFLTVTERELVTSLAKPSTLFQMHGGCLTQVATNAPLPAPTNEPL